MVKGLMRSLRLRRWLVTFITSEVDLETDVSGISQDGSCVPPPLHMEVIEEDPGNIESHASSPR